MPRRTRAETHQSRTIRFASGGALTLTLPRLADLVSLEPHDRAFVFALLDLMNEHDTSNGTGPRPPEES